MSLSFQPIKPVGTVASVFTGQRSLPASRPNNAHHSEGLLFGQADSSTRHIDALLTRVSRGMNQVESAGSDYYRAIRTGNSDAAKAALDKYQQALKNNKTHQSGLSSQLQDLHALMDVAVQAGDMDTARRFLRELTRAAK